MAFRKKAQRYFFLFVFLFFLVLLFFLLQGIFTAPSLFVRQTASESGDYALYFCQVDDCKEAFLSAINASSDISCAFYDLDVEEFKDALLAKRAAVLVFDENYNGFGTSVANEQSGLMHDKFCVLDGKTVLTGSMNPTENDVVRNDNNLFIITGEKLAKNYQAEFEELQQSAKRMGSAGWNGGEKPVEFARINHTDVATDRSFLVENYFCPEDNCEEHVLAALGRAHSSIRFMTFSFTSEQIGDLLVKKAAAGVNVSGVFETRQESKYSEYTGLRAASLDVRLDGNKYTMHHKVFLIDAGTPDATVVFGSYNPTANGNERNDENVLIVHDAEIAGKFLEEFERVWAAAQG
jgi:phosphatidylserine/phosphatidylglycerophosphate/cardiolipin synthase-like enzyme